MRRNDMDSIFLRYRYGSPHRVDVDLIGKIRLLIAKCSESKHGGPIDILRNLIIQINDGMGRGVSIESTWLRLMDECYSIFAASSTSNQFDYGLITKLLSLLLEEKAIDKVWFDIKDFILKNIDSISMWDSSHAKELAESRNTFRRENGEYCEISEGVEYHVLSSKTLEEEKFDYIVGTGLWKYGAIPHLLKFVALVFMSIDFQEYPEQYPTSLSIYLPESGDDCWFLRWQWKLDRPYGYSPSGWRPSNNHCDPDWLVSDLLACYSEEKIAERELKKFEFPADETAQRYEEAFKGFAYQLGYAVDTELRFGQDNEVYFDYKGRKIRWINASAHMMTIVVIPTKDLNETEEEENIVSSLISSLVWETGISIQKLYQVGGPKRFMPIISPAKNLGGLVLAIPKLGSFHEARAERQMLALALYKEGINSTSIYYSFLSYYKILELSSGFGRQRAIESINLGREYLMSKGHANRIKEIETLGSEFGSYIYESCRCAIAHSSQIAETANPDDVTDYRRITTDLPLIKELARRMIETGQFLNET